MLAEKKIIVSHQDEARKRKIDADEAWDLLKQSEEIFIGKGKKYASFKPVASAREEILKEALGRSGTLRAPTLQMKNKFIVGFNDVMYEELL